MYVVEIQNDTVKTEIHGVKQKLKSGNVVKGINTIDSFSFVMLPNNKGFNLINDYKTLVSVYNTNRNRYEFRGRALYSADDMDESGSITKDVTCESVLGYLCDSQQLYVAEKNWTVKGLFKHLIDCHNSQVEDYKHFAVGEITVTDDNDNLYIGIQRENTWDAIKTKLIDKLGGEIKYRIEGDVTYLDYLKEVGETKATPIALSVNMKTITREKDPTSYITRLIPLGCKLTKTVDGQTVETEERLDITSVNNGVNYIDDETAIDVYGIHVGYVEYDDVTTASALLSKGKKWMQENNRVQVKYSITALDLSLLGLVIDDFEVGNRHPIENALIGIDDTARIIKQNLNICEEVKSTMEVGDNFKTLTEIQREQTEALKNAAANLQLVQSTTNNLQAKISNLQVGARNLIKNSSTMIYVDYGFTDDGTSAVLGVATIGNMILGKG